MAVDRTSEEARLGLVRGPFAANPAPNATEHRPFRYIDSRAVGETRSSRIPAKRRRTPYAHPGPAKEPTGCPYQEARSAPSTPVLPLTSCCVT